MDHLQTTQDIDYVAVCSPNHLHFSHCATAMRMGADVICEKPLVLHPRDLEKLEKIQADTNSLCSVFCSCVCILVYVR